MQFSSIHPTTFIIILHDKMYVRVCVCVCICVCVCGWGGHHPMQLDGNDSPGLGTGLL